MMMMMMVSRPKSIKPTQREYLVRTTTNQIRSFIAKVYVLGTFKTKKASNYRQGHSIPSYHVSDDGDDDDDLDRQGKTIISAANNATHKIPASREAQDRVVGSRSLLGGLCNISLEAKEMVWGKRRLLDSCLCSVSLKMEEEERRGEGRKGKQVSRYVYQVYNLLKVLLPTRRHCTYYLVNQSAHLSIYLSICLSVCLLYMYKGCLLACWLAGWLLLLRGRPNHIISYHVMLHGRIYYYLTY